MFGRTSLIRFLAVLLLFFFGGCGLDKLNFGKPEPPEERLKGPAAVLLNIDGSFPELKSSNELFPQVGQSQYELESTIAKASSDPKVRELIVHLGSPQISFARAKELTDALLRFGSSGKPLTCHIDSANNVVYWMAARACPRILLSPAGSIEAIGLALEEVFFKDMLDSMGLKADILSVGQYKDAAEPVIRNGFSEQSKEALSSLLSELNRLFVGGIAAARKLSEDKTQEIINNGPYSADDALKLQLVDQVITLGAHLDAVRSKYSEGVIDDYGKPPKKAFSVQELITMISGETNESESAGHQRIAMVSAIGPIGSGASESLFGGMDMILDTPMVNALYKLAKDTSVRAVVIRIDSPGGSALASDNIWHAIRALAKVKPVVASMGEVAASGGYYIASAATETFALPSTITGSIGVIGGKLVVTDGASKIGIKSESIQFGKMANLGSPFSSFSDDERKALMGIMNKTYNIFVDRVVEGRGLDRQKVLDAAEGRVWTGSQALKLGLINQLGGLHEAVNRAIELSGSDPAIPIELYPKPKTFLEILGESLGDADAMAMSVAMNQSKTVAQAALLASLMKNQRVLAFTPFFFEIR